MPSKRTLIFGAVLIALVFVIQNQAAKDGTGIAAKIKNLGS
jgi:predicted outer membrane repeat protein